MMSSRRRLDAVDHLAFPDRVGKTDDGVDDREVVGNLGQRRSDGRGAGGEEVDDTISTERQHLDRVQRQVRIAGQLVGLLPERLRLRERDPGIGISERRGVEVRGCEDRGRVETEALAGADHGPARDAERRVAHGADDT
jgi:hypothetical protein